MTAVHVRQPRRGAPAPDGARGLPAIGPGASKRPGGQYLAEQGRGRRASATWRKTWCGKPGCKGHEQAMVGFVLAYLDPDDEGRCP